MCNPAVGTDGAIGIVDPEQTDEYVAMGVLVGLRGCCEQEAFDEIACAVRQSLRDELCAASRA